MIERDFLGIKPNLKHLFSEDGVWDKNVYDSEFFVFFSYPEMA